MQLARMAGARVIVTTGGADKLAHFCKRLAASSGIILKIAEEAVNKACETQAGGHPRRAPLLCSTFATRDRAEGMAAFAEKRKPSPRSRRAAHRRSPGQAGAGSAKKIVRLPSFRGSSSRMRKRAASRARNVSAV